MGYEEWFLRCHRSLKNFNYSQNYRIIITKRYQGVIPVCFFPSQIIHFQTFSCKVLDFQSRVWVHLNFSKSLGLPSTASNNQYLSSSFRQSLSFNPMLTFCIVRIGQLIMHSRINFFHVIIHLSSNMVVQNSDILQGVKNPAWFSLKINKL